MDWLKSLNSWTRRPADSADAPAAGLHARDPFHSIIQVERMRSDRSGSQFALAVFRMSESGDEQSTSRFAAELRSRIRATDHAGYMSESGIGVILWDTDYEGASSFVAKIQKTVTDSSLADVEIYLYPFAPDGDNEGPGKELSDWATEVPASALQSEVASSSGAINATDADSPTLATAVQPAIPSRHRPQTLTEKTVNAHLAEVETLIDQYDRAPVPGPRPLEWLFAQPLPGWKRALDVTGAVAGLLVLSPLLAGVALAIKLTSPGPILFSQLRSGLGGRSFRMLKFRSMVVDAEARKQELMALNEQDGPAFKMENDPRITPIGRLIRKTSIDELPQLWNVLRGEMSLVGPRPLPCHETDACQGWQRRRLEVTPGLTCIWQVQDSRTQIPFGDWARMDIRYIGKRTIRQDASLILQTFSAIFGRKGA